MAQGKKPEIAIIGGGIAGLTLAIGLVNRDANVVLYERAESFKEIGAGVSFSPNAVRAMHYCGDGIFEAYKKVASHNMWESKADVYFDFYHGAKDEGLTFSLRNGLGQNGVQRWQFLDELSKLFPLERARFGKNLDNIQTAHNGRLLLEFQDGTTAEADVVIGCDGIHSRVRKILTGPDSPSAQPNYTHKYAYRGLIPMEKAIAAIGEEKARNSCNFVGPNGHVLTFPINGGKTMNVVAFHTDPNKWGDAQKLTRWSRREAALKDFKAFGSSVSKILELVEPELNVWAIYELGSPPDRYCKGRVAITGDAAHATSPHMGSGAGFAIEDSACLAVLLSDERVQTAADIEAALKLYDEVRRERGRWLVENSRFTGQLYDLEFGDDMDMIKREMEARYVVINGYDIKATCDELRKGLGKRLHGEHAEVTTAKLS